MVLNISNGYHPFTLELEFMPQRLLRGGIKVSLRPNAIYFGTLYKQNQTLTLANRYHSSISENTQFILTLRKLLVAHTCQKIQDII